MKESDDDKPVLCITRISTQGQQEAHHVIQMWMCIDLIQVYFAYACMHSFHINRYEILDQYLCWIIPVWKADVIYLLAIKYSYYFLKGIQQENLEEVYNSRCLSGIVSFKQCLLIFRRPIIIAFWKTKFHSLGICSSRVRIVIGDVLNIQLMNQRCKEMEVSSCRTKDRKLGLLT